MRIKIGTILTWPLLALIGVMVITGGGVLNTSIGHVELSQVNAWMLGLIFLTAVFFGSLRPDSQNGWSVSPLVRCLTLIQDRLQNASEKFGWFGLLGSCVVLVGLFTLIHCARNWSFHTSIMDQGVIHHVLFSTWKRAAYACDTCPNGTFLADHLAFSLAWVAPIAKFRSHEAVFLLEAIIVGAGLFALIAAGPLTGRKELWLTALALLLCHPALRTAWSWDLREDHLAFLFLALTALCIYRCYRLGVLVFSVAAILCKENVALILPFLYGAWLMRSERRPWLLTPLLSLACLVWAFVSFKLLLPYFAGNILGTHEIVSRLPGMGGSPSEVMGNLLRHPDRLMTLILQRTFSKTGIHYLVGVLAPWIFLGARGWLWLLAAIPGILMNLISGAETQRSMQFHYELMILPFLAMALLEGLRAATRRQILIALGIALAFSGRWPGISLRQNWPSREQLTRTDWINQVVPKTGTLGVNAALFAQVSLRTDLRLLTFPDKLITVPPGEEVWKTFLDSNSSDRSGLPHHELSQAQWLLLDRTHAQELWLADQPAQGWQSVRKSPDGKLEILINTRALDNTH